MSNYPADQVCSPPELPPYLNNVCNLKPIAGVPRDEEVIGIHAVIRMAYKFVDVPDMCSPDLVAHLSEHLFNVQMAKYRSRHSCSVFHTGTTYTPPVLPAHVSSNLEPVSGTPSTKAIAKVQDALRLYQRFADIPTMFDPQLNADLSQHLFDIQMERYLQSSVRVQTSPVPLETVVVEPEFQSNPQVDDQANMATNNPGTGADDLELHPTSRFSEDIVLRDAVERSNRLAEQTNQLAERSNLLIERSNQIAERANQLVERSNSPSEPARNFTERLNELYEQLNRHLEQSKHQIERSNTIAEEFKIPLMKVGDTLKNINGVLVGIQHAIVRNHIGNTLDALDCLVNHEGETPGISKRTLESTFRWVTEKYSDTPDNQLPIMINGVIQNLWVPNWWLGSFLSFHGISKGMCVDEASDQVREGKEQDARERLGRYLSSCLG